MATGRSPDPSSVCVGPTTAQSSPLMTVPLRRRPRRSRAARSRLTRCMPRPTGRARTHAGRKRGAHLDPRRRCLALPGAVGGQGMCELGVAVAVRGADQRVAGRVHRRGRGRLAEHGRGGVVPVGEDHDADVAVDDAAAQVLGAAAARTCYLASRARWHGETRGATSLRRHCPEQVGGGRHRIFRSFGLSAVQCDLSGSLAAARVPLIMRPGAAREQGRRSSFESASRR